MLERLYSNKNIQQVLLFLFVNNRTCKAQVSPPDICEGKCQASLLIAFWERLKQVKQFVRIVASRHENGWNGDGRGAVFVSQPTGTILIFHERGSWHTKLGQDINFSNTWRWTIDRSAGVITLEHLRLGPNQPVFLCQLRPLHVHLLAAIAPHVCAADIYMATVHWNHHSICLNWRIIGLQKNEELESCYT